MEEKKTIRVLYVEPYRQARVIQLGAELEDMQEAVQGDIEGFYPFEEQVAIVCNDESKLNGMSPNRAVYDEDGTLMDIVFGPFFVCSCAGENFDSLSQEQIRKYQEMFGDPQRFYMKDKRIVAVPYKVTAQPDREVR